MDSIIYPEGKHIPYTVSKKILLARAIVLRPKLLILKDPLDQFDQDEERRIIKFLTDPAQPWALVVVSNNSDWESSCSEILRIENGTLIK